MKQTDRTKAVLETLLQLTRKRFYSYWEQTYFFRYQRFLKKCVTWPASWMDRRGVAMPAKRYESLLKERIEDIATNGNHRKIPYFPKYFLSCLQDHFAHHGEDLYYDLKKARNIFDLSFENLDKLKIREEDQTTKILSEAHKILATPKPKKRPRKPLANGQRELF